MLAPLAKRSTCSNSIKYHVSMFVNVFKNVVIFANRWLQTAGSPTEGVREAQGWICTFLNNVYKIKELKFSYKDTWQGLNSNIGLWNSHKLLTIYWSCLKVAPNSKSCQKVAEQLLTEADSSTLRLLRLALPSPFFLVDKNLTIT